MRRIKNPKKIGAIIGNKRKDRKSTEKSLKNPTKNKTKHTHTQVNKGRETRRGETGSEQGKELQTRPYLSVQR